MKIVRFLQGRIHAFKIDHARRQLRQQYRGVVNEITRDQWSESLQDPTAFYIRCCHYFDKCLPSELIAHRHYFKRQRRGFGEDAFHVMWFILFREFRPINFLEIGVFRGQTLSLAAMLARQFGLNCFVQGISPFSSAGDTVSRYRASVNYYDNTLKNFAHFSLPAPTLLKAYSTDVLARELIASRSWSVIYIDGNHDYEIARQDWNICSQNLQKGGIIVLDDAALVTAYCPPLFASGGHPGPSRLAQEINRQQFHEILHVGHNRVFQKVS
ncbi:MAG TPA: class I SAM-dependent methyltransferase [Verrucomicrobiae bacterium]|nr:class I SAM-dependent methyltransferase [Verrucomicrobiae bacterium]